MREQPMTLEERNNLIYSYQRIFRTEDGTKVLEHLSKMLGGARTSHVPNDPYSTAFNEGMRNAFISIKAIIDTDPDNIPTGEAANDYE